MLVRIHLALPASKTGAELYNTQNFFIFSRMLLAISYLVTDSLSEHNMVAWLIIMEDYKKTRGNHETGCFSGILNINNASWLQSESAHYIAS